MTPAALLGAWGALVTSLVTFKLVQGAPARKAAKRERLMQEMRTTSSGLRVTEIQHDLHLSHAESHMYWEDAHDRERGLRPRSEVAAEHATQIAANRALEQQAPLSFHGQYMASVAEGLRAGIGRIPLPEGPMPIPATAPHDPLFLQKLISTMEKGDPARARMWVTGKPAKKTTADSPSAVDMVAAMRRVQEQMYGGYGNSVRVDAGMYDQYRSGILPGRWRPATTTASVSSPIAYHEPGQFTVSTPPPF